MGHGMHTGRNVLINAGHLQSSVFLHNLIEVRFIAFIPIFMLNWYDKIFANKCQRLNGAMGWEGDPLFSDYYSNLYRKMGFN